MPANAEQSLQHHAHGCVWVLTARRCTEQSSFTCWNQVIVKKLSRASGSQHCRIFLQDHIAGASSPEDLRSRERWLCLPAKAEHVMKASTVCIAAPGNQILKPQNVNP